MTKTAPRTTLRQFYGPHTYEYEANGDDTYNLIVDGETVGRGLTYREMVAEAKAL